MTQHFTKNTVSASFYCNKCGKFTQHKVSDGRKAHCLECAARLDQLHIESRNKEPQAVQEGLFSRV